MPSEAMEKLIAMRHVSEHMERIVYQAILFEEIGLPLDGAGKDVSLIGANHE